MNGDNDRFPRTPYVLLGLGAALFLFGSWWGLFLAPREQYMGDVQRIMYVHVPTAWNWMLGPPRPPVRLTPRPALMMLPKMSPLREPMKNGLAAFRTPPAPAASDTPAPASVGAGPSCRLRGGR